MYDIKTEIMLYNIRKVAIEDMKLRIDEIKLGDNFNEIGYDEKFQSSKNCPNNDRDMNEIERLEKKIKLMELGNRRVDNNLKMLDGIELEVIDRLLIRKESKSKVARTIDRTVRQVNRILAKAISIIEEEVKTNVPKVS